MTWVKPKFEFVELCSRSPPTCTTGRSLKLRRGSSVCLGLRHTSPPHARSCSRLGRRRRLSAVELPLRDVRGRARGRAGLPAHAVVAGDPWGRRAVVSGQRLAGCASAARDACVPARGRRPRAADRRRPPDRCRDRPHGRASAAARVRDAGARLRRCGRRARAAPGLSRARDAGALLRGRVADARAGAGMALEGSSLAVEPFDGAATRRAI